MVDMSRYNKLRINPDRYNYDLVTNLPLRRTFWRIADKTVLFDNKTYCILAIDIENFHLINKWYGRETGDELLIEIGEALKSIDAGYGTISGYMGGDNFCVIFEENDEKEYQVLLTDTGGMILQGHIMVHIRLQIRI